MPLFGSLFKSKDKSNKNQVAAPTGPPRPSWTDAWKRTDVGVIEIAELVHAVTQTLKSKGVDRPFWLLPFRLDATISHLNSAKNIISRYSQDKFDHTNVYTGDYLRQDLALTDVPALASVLRWCWSRIPGGVVTWEAYEMFRQGETDSGLAKHAFDTFIPISVDSDARRHIIFDFFDLMASMAATKSSGFGAKLLSRYLGFYAFELDDGGKGLEGGFNNWQRAADATMHLFFAYLRSKSPDNTRGAGGITDLPRALQSLLASTEYPPETPTLLMTQTHRVLMIVNQVSPTPFSLLRRAKHFEYRDDMAILQEYSTFEDPVEALTDECRRVLTSISAVNQTSMPAAAVDRDNSWIRFEETGFNLDFDPLSSNGKAASIAEEPSSALPQATRDLRGLRDNAGTTHDADGRPKTPSWGDFLSRGFMEGNQRGPHGPVLLPPDKQLPPIGERAQSSQSHVRRYKENQLEPGELANIFNMELDESFWWAWMTSLSPEETDKRKGIFGRCCLIEVAIPGARWLIIEEQVKDASPGQGEGAILVEKKSKFSFTRRGKGTKRTKSIKKDRNPYDSRSQSAVPPSKTSIAPDQQAKISAAAAELARKENLKTLTAERRARKDDQASVKTTSVLTLQPAIMSGAAPAMKWAKEFDKDVIRAKYLTDKQAGTGHHMDVNRGGLSTPRSTLDTNGRASPMPSTHINGTAKKDLPSLPLEHHEAAPSPVPLPVTPTVGHSSNAAESSKAAEIPLPVASPADEKPIPPPPPHEQPDISQHPALRQQESEQPASPEASSKTAKVAPKKLKKQSAGGGFKKLFSRKKTEAPAKVDSSKQQNLLTVPESLAREPDVRSPSPAVTDMTSIRSPTPEPVVAMSPAIDQSAAVTAVSQEHNGGASYTEPHESENEFSRFDQGPLEDVPAFVPEDSETATPRPLSHASYEASEISERPVSGSYDTQSQVPAGQYAEDDISEASVDLSQQASPVQDRWAQIRKNAAERATRLSEERSHRSQQSQSVRTDEGETSGEETIEHRVARIKARVAELTGQMDSSGKINVSSK